MPRDADYLTDILDAADLIQSYVDGVDSDALQSDPMRRDGVMRQLQIIGEAAGKLSDEFHSSRPDVPWRQMIGMRNVLVHQYRFVDLDVVWLAAIRDIPELVRLLTRGSE